MSVAVMGTADTLPGQEQRLAANENTVRLLLLIFGCLFREHKYYYLLVDAVTPEC